LPPEPPFRPISSNIFIGPRAPKIYFPFKNLCPSPSSPSLFHFYSVAGWFVFLSISRSVRCSPQQQLFLAHPLPNTGSFRCSCFFGFLLFQIPPLAALIFFPSRVSETASLYVGSLFPPFRLMNILSTLRIAPPR